MEIKFGPSSLITIESSGYARPFDRTPVEEHTCRHPRRDVEGLVTASHCNAQLTCQDCCNHSCTAAITLTCWISAGTSLSVPSDILTTYRPALLAEESVWAPLPPACKHVNIETWKKVLPWITGLYTHTHIHTIEETTLHPKLSPSEEAPRHSRMHFSCSDACRNFRM